MRKLCFGVILLYSSVVMAQGQVTTVIKGSPVPFSGTLMDSDAVAKIIADKEYAQKQFELDKALALAKLEARLNLDLSNIKLERDILQKKYDTIVGLKDAELSRAYATVEKASKAGNYKWVWFAVGVAAGAALTVGVTFAAAQAVK